MNGRETSSRDLTVYVRYGSNGLQRYLPLHSWNLNGYMAKKTSHYWTKEFGMGKLY